MRKLTARGIGLARTLRLDGHAVFEGYPGAAQDIMKIPRKGVSEMELAARLRKLGLEIKQEVTHDELDAISCAFVGFLYLNGKSELIGDSSEGQILLPLPG